MIERNFEQVLEQALARLETIERNHQILEAYLKSTIRASDMWRKRCLAKADEVSFLSAIIHEIRVQVVNLNGPGPGGADWEKSIAKIKEILNRKDAIDGNRTEYRTDSRQPD